MLHINLTISPTDGTAATITIEQDTMDWAFQNDKNRYDLLRLIQSLKEILVSMPVMIPTMKGGDNID